MELKNLVLYALASLFAFVFSLSHPAVALRTLQPVHSGLEEEIARDLGVPDADYKAGLEERSGELGDFELGDLPDFLFGYFAAFKRQLLGKYPDASFFRLTLIGPDGEEDSLQSSATEMLDLEIFLGEIRNKLEGIGVTPWSAGEWSLRQVGKVRKVSITAGIDAGLSSKKGLEVRLSFEPASLDLFGPTSTGLEEVKERLDAQGWVANRPVTFQDAELILEVNDSA